MSTEVAVATDLSREKIELIKQTVAKGATDLELELFLHACKRTGLDPLMKQVYAIKRWSNTDNREVMSFQTGIDGYRLIADRTGKYAGSDEPSFMVSADGLPEVASVTVTKMVDGVPCKFSASARWGEYVQKNRQNQPTSMWLKMPFLMLGKCAEALALRKAFPAELSGVYTHEEMMQADNEPQIQVRQNPQFKQVAQAKIAELAKEMQGPMGFSQAEILTASKKVQEMQEPARQEEEGDGLEQLLGKSQLARMQPPTDDVKPFIWNMGSKWKGTPIEEIPLEYLSWACTNISRDDYRMAAINEIDRRQKQDVMAFEEQK
jgi:phage recombination protein Bet